ncbi:cytosolic carboxypeptidase 3 [Pelodytes ibericus]
MSDDTEKEDLLPVPGNASSSDAESGEDLYESEDGRSYELYPGEPPCNGFSQRTTQIVFDYQSGRKVARLREPRDLYGVSSNSFLHLARWPYECDVLKERVDHIEWNPPSPEPMYRATGLETEPACVEPAAGKVVYLASEGNKESCFMCSRVGGNRNPLQEVIPQKDEHPDTTLVFEARFESGNLQKVVQTGDYEYQLTLRTDLYTVRHTQWFYFRVKNTRANVPYRFTIVNFMKPTSLYSHGMRPLIYSEAEAESHLIGWHRIGDEIKYYKNNLGQEGKPYYSLSWTFKFPHSSDTCYFAYCYPYTYSNLQDYLADIANDPERSKYCKIRVLCHSLAGNMVYVLTITNPSSGTEECKKKKAVIVTARVHPGETNSSWVMKGFLDYILSCQVHACLLRDTFVFKVVPMLNPDGVIVGNYRCSLTGRDLNRNYKSRLKDSFPSIWFTRNMIKRVMEEREVLLYCDLHGHSRKQNVFMYGCKGKGVHAEDSDLCEHIFPFMLSKNSPEKFSFSACKFKVQRSKEGTGRVVMWKMGVRNSYTLEATFCGSSLGNRRGTHFSTKDLESLGYHFCDALLDYCDLDRNKFYLCQKEVEEIMKQRRHGSKLPPDTESLLADVVSDLDSSSGGSDSSDSNGPPAHLMELAAQVKPRSKQLKSKKERNTRREQQGMNLRKYLQVIVLLFYLQKPPLYYMIGPVGAPELNQQRIRDKTVTQLNGIHFTELRWTEPAENESPLEKQLSLPGMPGDQQKMPWMGRNILPKPPRGQLFQDSGSKKVSVIYLMFNTKGEVITTKSHSCVWKEAMADISGVQWNKPELKSFLPPRFPLTGLFQHCCYCKVEIGNCGLLKSNPPNHKSGEAEPTTDTAKLPVSFYMHNQSKHPSSKCQWARKTPVKTDPRASPSYDPINQPMLPPPEKPYTSSPPTTKQDMPDHPVSGPFSKDTGGHISRLAPQRSIWQSGSSREKKDVAAKKQVIKEISLPAVPTSKGITGLYKPNGPYPTPATNFSSVQNLLPKMVSNLGTVKSSTALGIHPSKKLKAKSLGHGRTLTVNRRKLGNFLSPQTKSNKVVKENDHPKLLVGTWKDVLVELQSREAVEPAESIPLIMDAEFQETTLKKRPCNGYANNIRMPGAQLGLVHLELTNTTHEEII